MSEPNPDFVHEKVQGVDVVTFCDRAPTDSEQIARIKQSLCDLVDGGADRLILDFRNVEYVCSLFLGMLLFVRKRLSVKKPFRDFRLRHWEGFETCPDREHALEAISGPECDPLVFCSVRSEIREIFKVCGARTDAD